MSSNWTLLDSKEPRTLKLAIFVAGVACIAVCQFLLIVSVLILTSKEYPLTFQIDTLVLKRDPFQTRSKLFPSPCADFSTYSTLYTETSPVKAPGRCPPENEGNVRRLQLSWRAGIGRTSNNLHYESP